MISAFDWENNKKRLNLIREEKKGSDQHIRKCVSNGIQIVLKIWSFKVRERETVKRCFCFFTKVLGRRRVLTRRTHHPFLLSFFLFLFCKELWLCHVKRSIRKHPFTTHKTHCIAKLCVTLGIAIL